MARLAIIVGFCSGVSAEVIRVTAGADSEGVLDGGTWATATHLTRALELASPGDEVWVAGGLYPTDSIGGEFRLESGVAMFGGFAGDETDRGERDLAGAPSVLSGDFHGDDLGGNPHGITETPEQILGSNSARLIEIEPGGAEDAVIDGFTLTGCRQGNQSGAIYNFGGKILIENCHFAGNFGGVRNINAECRVVNCRFTDNTQRFSGGAIESRNCDLTVEGSTFERNHSTGYEGGAISCVGGDVTIANSRFYRNNTTGSSQARGGAIAFLGNSDVLVTGCLFWKNHADLEGGAIGGLSSDPTVTNCTFVGNTSRQGGALGHVVSALHNSILWGNRASAQVSPTDPSHNTFNSALYFVNCLVEHSGGSATWDTEFGVDGGGNIDLDPRLSSIARDFHPEPDSPVIDAGEGLLLPLDRADLDRDGDVDEAWPVDLGGLDRIAGSTVDIGAWEHRGPRGSGFPNEPLRVATGTTSRTAVLQLADLFDASATMFSLLGNDRPDLLSASVNPGDGTVDLVLQSDAVGVATLTLGATDAAGDIAAFEFRVSVFPPVLHVMTGATGAGNGLSWEDAIPTLREALALGGDGYQIWVSSGVYYPDVVNGSRKANFELRDGVAIFGGFAGDETSLADRDLSTASPSFLSGDLGRDDLDPDGDGGPNKERDIVGENSFHVVSAHGAGESAVLDGFTIVAGQADHLDPITREISDDGRGGGLFFVDGGPSVRNCIIRGHVAWKASAIFLRRSSPRFFNCLIDVGYGIRDDYVPLMEMEGSAPEFTHCTFCNQVVLSVDFGYADSTPAFRNCILWGCGKGVRGVVVGGETDRRASYSHSLIKGAYFPFGDLWNRDLGIDDGANSGDDPRFIPGVGLGFTADFFEAVEYDSPAVDASLAADLPLDSDDLDGDGDVLEPYPYDLAGRARVVDGDNDGVGVADMGAFEYLPELHDGDGDGFTDAFEFSLTGGAITLQTPTLSMLRDPLAPGGPSLGAVFEADARLDGLVEFVLEASEDLGGADLWQPVAWPITSSGIADGVLRVEFDAPTPLPAGREFFLRLRATVIP